MRARFFCTVVTNALVPLPTSSWLCRPDRYRRWSLEILPLLTHWKALQMSGCHSLMLGYGDQETPDIDWDCAHFEDEILGFAAVNSTKPGRSGGLALVVQTQHLWSEGHIEDDLDTVAAAIKHRFETITGLKTDASGYNRVHRWRYASTQTAAASAARPFLLDDSFLSRTSGSRRKWFFDWLQPIIPLIYSV